MRVCRRTKIVIWSFRLLISLELLILHIAICLRAFLLRENELESRRNGEIRPSKNRGKVAEDLE